MYICQNTYTRIYSTLFSTPFRNKISTLPHIHACIRHLTHTRACPHKQKPLSSAVSQAIFSCADNHQSVSHSLSLSFSRPVASISPTPLLLRGLSTCFMCLLSFALCLTHALRGAFLQTLPWVFHHMRILHVQTYKRNQQEQEQEQQQ